MLPKGILFDLDDTIIAYTQVAEPTWKRICETYANQTAAFRSDELFRQIRRASTWYWSDKERHKKGRNDLHAARRDIVGLAFQALGIQDDALAREIADGFSEQREKEVYFFKGAEETLQYLKTQNVALALLTNGEAKKQRNKIKRFNLGRFFTSILIEGELGFGKPDEAVYTQALDELGLAPEDVWAVGDHLEWDVQGPQNLGIFSIWNDYGKKGLPDSSASSAIIPDRIIHNISELIE
jgi:putative hydrolase of the HAD superfamily